MGRSIDNSTNFSSNIGGSSTQSTLADGTEALPSLSFTNESSTGLYRISAGVLGISTSGVNRINLSSTSMDLKSILYIAPGTAAIPGISFRIDTNSGLYRIAADNLGLSCNGIKQVDISTSNVLFTNPIAIANSGFSASLQPTTLSANRTVTLPNESGNLVLDTSTQTLTNKTITLPTGTDLLPSLNFSGDTTTGIYSTSGVFGITTAAAYRMLISASNIECRSPVFIPAGTVTVPGLSFLTDQNSGLYRIGASNLGITCGGVKQIDISASNTTFTNKITLANGAVATPSLVFTGASTTGLSFVSSSLKFSLSAVEKLAMSSTLTTFSSNQIVVPVGSFSVPSISYSGDITTGPFSIGAGVLNWTCSGASMLQLSSTALDLKATQFTTGAGSAAVPSHSFGPDTSTGLYRVAASTIGLTCGGTKQLDLSSIAAQFTPPVFSSNQPYYSVLGTGGAQTIATGTDTTITNTIWGGSGTTQGTGITLSGGFYTVANAGIYNISASLFWTGSSATGQRTIYIWKNSATQLSYESSAASTTVSPYISISLTVKLAAADTISIRAYQDSGGNVNISSNGVQSFTIARLS